MEVLHAEFHISASTPRPLTDPQPTVSPRRSEAHSVRPATPKPSTVKTESRRPLPRLLPVHTVTYGGPVHQVSALYASLGYSATTAAKSSPGEEGLSSRLDTSTPALDWQPAKSPRHLSGFITRHPGSHPTATRLAPDASESTSAKSRGRGHRIATRRGRLPPPPRLDR
jgi:hypothetical protein